MESASDLESGGTVGIITHPWLRAWEAARCMVMGVMAHKSALRDGETLSIPDFGEPPG